MSKYYVKNEYIDIYGLKVTKYNALSMQFVVELHHDEFGTPIFTKIKTKNGAGNDGALNIGLLDSKTMEAIYIDIIKNS